MLYYWKGDHQSAEEIIVSLLRGLYISLNQRSNTDLELLALLCLVRSHIHQGNNLLARACHRLHKPILSECLKRFKPPNNITIALMVRVGHNAIWHDCNESQVLLGQAYRHSLSISSFGRDHPRTLTTYCLLVRLNIEQGYFDKARKMLSKLEARLRNTDKSTWATLNWGSLFDNMSYAYRDLKFREEEKKFALLSLQADRKGLEISHRFLTFSATRYVESLEGLVLPADMSKQVTEFLKDERRRIGLHVLHEQYWEIFLKSSNIPIGTLISSCANISSAITVIDNIVGLYRECKTDPWQLWSEEVSDAYNNADLRQALSKAIKVHGNVTKLFGTYSQWFQPRHNFTPNILMTILLETLLHGVDSEGKNQGWRMSTALSNAHLQTSYAPLNNEYVTIWHSAWSEVERAALAYDINCYVQPEHLGHLGIESKELELTVLMSVTLSGSVPAVDLVMSKQPSIHAENSTGDTALFYAAKGHHFDIFITMLKGYDRDQPRPKMVFSETSLLHLISRKTWQTHAEAKIQQQNAAVELLDRCTEADLEMKDGDGKTPLDVARSDKVVGLAKIFENFIAKRKRF
jgi:ankyrin repeat protein